MDSCPYCQSKAGYYTKMQASGTIKTRFNFDGSEADNTEMYNSLKHTGGHYTYCATCHKRLFRVK